MEKKKGAWRNMKKSPRILLHMHQLRDFIDDRYSFYNKFYFGIEPEHYRYKGVQKAFKVGSAVDFGIKTYYMNIMNNKDPEEGVLNSEEFKTLPSKVDQTIVLSLVYNYISKYHDNEDTKEYFQKYEIVNWKVPMLKNYMIYASPDIVAYDLDNNLFIIEIKTSGTDEELETLDFQTMTYAWASYMWNRKVPKGVLKRVLYKPRIKQKKDENESNFIKRLVMDISDGDYIKSNFRETNLDMIHEHGKYLTEILKELDSCLKSKNKYKFYKTSGAYHGTLS